MAALIALLAAMLGWASPVLAGDASQNPACDLSLARKGEALPADITASARVRIVRPGQVVTQEFATDRATIILDTEGVVVSVRCG